MSGKLVLIGSGEVAPGMVSLHRRLLKELGPQARAAFLDTPAGFELGLASIHERFTRFFADRLQIDLHLASYRGGDDPAASIGAALDVIHHADYVIAGPGSPSYAIRHWSGSPVFAALVERWQAGATLVFASSAAVAIGRRALPVYEIYKVGEPLHWIAGLDVLGAQGLDLAIVPHWNNAEGGTHDTRACFMGLERFERLRRMLPPGASVLGVDEHTACVFDGAAGKVTVSGRGSATILWGDARAVHPAGSSFSLDELRGPTVSPFDAAEASGPPLQADPHQPSSTVQAATLLAGGDLPAGLRALAQASPPDQASVLQLAAAQAERLAATAEDPSRWIDLLVSTRELLREARQWSASDRVRDELAALGIDVRDTPQGPLWERRA
jgi:hypothetical protein